jgi:hypothetical protein
MEEGDNPCERIDGERSGGDGVARSGPIYSPISPVAPHVSVMAYRSFFVGTGVLRRSVRIPESALGKKPEDVFGEDSGIADWISAGCMRG